MWVLMWDKQNEPLGVYSSLGLGQAGFLGWVEESPVRWRAGEMVLYRIDVNQPVGPLA